MKSLIPQSIKLEHEELHTDLEKATREGGKVGSAAEEVARLLHQHFESEEEFAMPPLGYLSVLAAGEPVEDAEGVLALSRRLADDLPKMLQEHGRIVDALKVLIRAAEEDDKPEHIRFAEKLMLHAKNEEEVLYPATILVGKYLELTGPLHSSLRQGEPVGASS